MTPEEQALLEQLQALEGQKQSGLEALASQLGGLQQGNAAQLGIDGLGGFNDSLNSSFGTNFASSEAISNQRNALLSGNDPLSQSLRNQFKVEQEGRNSEEKALRERLKTEREFIKSESTAQKSALDLEKKQLEIEEKKAKIRNLNTPKSSSGGAVGGKPLTLNQEFNNKVKEQRAFSKEFTDPVRKQVENDQKKLVSGLGSLKGALKSGNIKSIVSQMSNFAKIISGESGVLTDKDISRQFSLDLKDKAKALTQFLTGKTAAQLRTTERSRLIEVVNSAITSRAAAYNAFIDRRANSVKLNSRLSNSILKKFADEKIGDNGETFLELQVSDLKNNIQGSLTPIQDLEIGESERVNNAGFFDTAKNFFGFGGEDTGSAQSAIDAELSKRGIK